MSASDKANKEPLQTKTFTGGHAVFRHCAEMIIFDSVDFKAEWFPERTGIQIWKFEKTTKVGILNSNGAYQEMTFRRDDYEKITEFFIDSGIGSNLMLLGEDLESKFRG